MVIRNGRGWQTPGERADTTGFPLPPTPPGGDDKDGKGMTKSQMDAYRFDSAALERAAAAAKELEKSSMFVTAFVLN